MNKVVPGFYLFLFLGLMPCLPLLGQVRSEQSRRDLSEQIAVDQHVSTATIDADGIRVHVVDSRFQSGRTKIRLLLPQKMSAGKCYPVVYLLPVEPNDERRYGDGLAEAKRLKLADHYGVICVAPTFSELPWYADHPTNPRLRQESYFVQVVVPAVDRLYPTIAKATGRNLVGFSKSGWGAFCLLLRHPEIFGRAAGWDAPWTMDWPSKYGSQPIFGTAENFSQYRIFSLLEQRASQVRNEKQLVVAGRGNFLAETEAIHGKLKELGVPHTYLDGPQRKHDWHSGWLADVTAALFAE